MRGLGKLALFCGTNCKILASQSTPWSQACLASSWLRKVIKTVAQLLLGFVGVRNLMQSIVCRPRALPNPSSVVLSKSSFLSPFARIAKVLQASLACSPNASWIHCLLFVCQSLVAESWKVTIVSPLGSLRAAMAPFRPEALLIAWTTSAEVLAARLVRRSFPRMRISIDPLWYYFGRGLSGFPRTC